VTVNRQFLLARRPEGLPQRSDFERIDTDVPKAGEGEVVVRNLYISLDPAIRGWIDEGETYREASPLGAPVHAVTIGRVVESRHPAHEVGNLASGITGWADYVALPGDLVAPLPADPGLPLSQLLGVMGPPGFTSYFGLLDIGKPVAGETVLVSAAAGAVGSIVGQIAKFKGCRAVGIAGSEEKCAWICDELGFDAAINYKTSQDLRADIAKACPGGVDIYFDNVGGPILEAALDSLNVGARVPLCGMISGYNAENALPIHNVWRLLVKRARLEGFIISDYAARFPEAMAEMGPWLMEGKLKHREHVVDGFDALPDAFQLLFKGENQGKLVVKVADE
jgi:NADPH-dependent curcumin reductase CurA